MLDRRTWLAQGLVVIGTLGIARAGARSERPLRLVVPFSAGSMIDRIGRALAQEIASRLNHPVVTDNLPGAGGNLGVDHVARAEPDGMTLVLAGDAAITINVGTADRAGFDPQRDLVPISQIVITPNVLVVSPALGVQSVAELVVLAKTRGVPLTYASSGVGTSQHRGGEQLARRARIELTHVPYGGTSSMIPDLIAGRVDMLFGSAGTVLPLVRDGRLRALAVGSRTRLGDAIDLPTMAEAGFPGVESVAWFGLFAPAHSPLQAIERLEHAAVAAVAAPTLRAPFDGNGLIWVGGSRAALAQLIQHELQQHRTRGGR